MVGLLGIRAVSVSPPC